VAADSRRYDILTLLEQIFGICLYVVGIVSQMSNSRYESHTTEIPLDALIFLADFFDTSVDYLLGRTRTTKRYPK